MPSKHRRPAAPGKLSALDRQHREIDRLYDSIGPGPLWDFFVRATIMIVRCVRQSPCARQTTTAKVAKVVTKVRVDQ